MSLYAMQEALRTYLDSKADVAALGLNQFWLHRGEPIPFVPPTARTAGQGTYWLGSKLPLLGSSAIRELTDRIVGTGREIKFTVKLHLVLATTGSVGSRASMDAIDQAISVMTAALGGNDNRRARLNAAGVIDDHEILPGGQIIPWPPDHNTPGSIAAWEWQFDVRLTGVRRLA